MSNTLEVPTSVIEAAKSIIKTLYRHEVYDEWIAVSLYYDLNLWREDDTDEIYATIYRVEDCNILTNVWYSLDITKKDFKCT